MRAHPAASYKTFFRRPPRKLAASERRCLRRRSTSQGRPAGVERASRSSTLTYVAVEELYSPVSCQLRSLCSMRSLTWLPVVDERVDSRTSRTVDKKNETMRGILG